MAASEQSSRRQLEAIFIATPPQTPLMQHNSVTRTTTPRELPTMYHFDFAAFNTENELQAPGGGQEEEEPSSPPPPPLTRGLPLPVPETVAINASDLTPCPCCSRTFNLNALRKHVVICEKTSKKRKIFDSSRQRREGTLLSTYVLPKNFGLPNAEKLSGVHTPLAGSRDAVGTVSTIPTDIVGSPLPTRRKSQTELVRSTARASVRRAGGGATAESAAGATSPAGEPNGVPARDRSLAKRIRSVASERCPHCERSFNVKAFDRHVEWCKEKAVQATIKCTNTQETTKAKERLDARKQYRPPNLKTKRSINRNKYSGNHEELLDAGDMTAPKPNLMSLSSMTSSVHSDNSPQAKKLTRSHPKYVTPASRSKPAATSTKVTQNTVNLHVDREEEPAAAAPPPPPKERVLRSKRKPIETCDRINKTMNRLRSNNTSSETLQLDCVEAAPLQPVPKPRKGRTNCARVKAAEREMSLPPLKFEDLNRLIKQKGRMPNGKSTKLLEEPMQIPDAPQLVKVASKVRSSTSLVRQACCRIRTREHPSLELRNLGKEAIVEAYTDDEMDRALVPVNRRQRVVYSGSEYEDDSPRAEIQIKMETTTTRTVCRPNKRMEQASSSMEMNGSMDMPQLKQSLEELGHTMGHTILPRLQLGSDRLQFERDVIDRGNDETSELEWSEENMMRGGSTSRIFDEDMQHFEESDLEAEVDQRPITKLPPLPRQGGGTVSRRLVMLEQDENGTMYIKEPPTAQPRPSCRRAGTFTSGLSGASVSSDKYDPFLSAKRQLEELCSPGTPPDEEEVQPTATPSISMSTSLTMPSGKAAPITPKPTPASNFRRTSSLRGPRRTPLLPSRPLFATNYRPTIQRGLSDEGPISTNFLKPEEYDEMPVRAACVNDFHSPRVVRRDTSSSNRKQLKLPLGAGGASEAAAQAQPGGRNVTKTDSLAVFLKYEHELEQLNAKAAEVAAANQLNSKELKDKSNNLSKQNSAKSLTACSNASQLPPLTPVSSAPVTATAASTPSAPGKENNEKRLHNNYQPIATPLRLEPIGRPATAMPAISGGVPASLTPIKLESIFGFGRPAAVSGNGEFIDPKLINACDNLHMSSGVASSEASSTPQQLSQSRSRSSSQSTITYERRQSGEARNLLKRKMRLGRNQFLYDASPEDADASSGCSADDEANRSSMEYDEQCWQQQQKQLLANPLPMVMQMGNMPTFDDFDFEEFLSSFENENDDEQFPLFKDCREFLLNRSTSRQRSFQKATSTPQQTATATLRPDTTSSLLQPKSQPTKDTHAHRSNSNGLITKGDEKHQLQQQLQRQQSNSSSIGSHEEKMPQKMQQLPLQRPADDQQKREIFISIETEANDHGRSPISPDSLRHMVGNSQTPIDVLQIENGNEPEHARFRKISDDTEDNPYVAAQGEHDDRASQLAGNASRLALSSSDSVQVNNAKNLIQKMQSEFRQMGEDAGASIRTLFIRRPDEQSREMEPEPVQQQQQQQVKASSPLTPSASADSDELSSLDGYPMSSSHSSRRGASSKLSSDSAYGSTNSPYSLSRQRSGDLQPGTPRNQTLLRPHTASAKLPSVLSDASTQAHNAYSTLKARHRLYGGGGAGLGLGIGNGNTDGAESSSSGSEHSLTMATQQAPQEQQQQQQQHNRPDSNFNYQQQMQSQSAYNSNNNNNNNMQMTPLTPTTSQHSLLSNASVSSLSSSTKMSKFCHECGGRFIIEHAKFCMDCGVRRMIL
ncbi:blast:Zinc finger C2HC domain-containing protein 1A [Drosophila guanche]|uniref:Blast:Zinc finger C2HC domain-containing protein 1A n=1 Tax=Drosophila guanche TaxID=7266 RepID=A0A3B0IZ78_DROGU|nr:blast:Zinc finger C2HC domain-containing protein 1A [Drosophila guanche]